MHREILVVLPSAIALTLAACIDQSPTPPSARPTATARRSESAEEERLDVPLAGLTPAELDRFNRGREVFTRVFTDATGLGPSFNAPSCASCHEEPSVGGVGDDLDQDVETHVSVASGEACDDLAAFGGPVIEAHTTQAFQA